MILKSVRLFRILFISSRFRDAAFRITVFLVMLWFGAATLGWYAGHYGWNLEPLWNSQLVDICFTLFFYGFIGSTIIGYIIGYRNHSDSE